MSLYNTYQTDENKELNGINIAFPECEDEKDGTVPIFTVARMGPSNKKYTKAFEAATKPYRRQMDLGTLPESKSEELLRDVFAKTILKGWKNVKDKEGKALTFNVKNAKMILKDLPDIFEILAAEAKKYSNFKSEGLEKDAKN